MTRPENVQSVKNYLRGKTTMGIFGNPGVGKTRLAASSDHPLIIHPPTDHLDSVPPDANVDHWVVRDHDDLFEAYEYLRQLKPRAVEWDWVWLDSVSLYQDHDVDAIHEDVVASKPHRKDTPPDMSEWSLESRETGRWFRHMVALAKDHSLFNFGFTAHAMELPMPPDDDLLLMPAVRGKNMPSKLCGYMNVVGYLQVKEKKLVMRTTATDRYYAKDQYHAWPDGRVIEPTMPKITRAIAATRQPAKTADLAAKRRTRRRKAAAAS